MSTIPPILRGHSWRTDVIDVSEAVVSGGVSWRETTFRDGLIWIQSTHETEIENCVFRNCGLILVDVWDLTISNCQFVGFDHGNTPLMIISQDRQTNTVRIKFSRFENNESHRNIDIKGPNVREVVIHDCKFHSKKSARRISHIVAEQVNMLTVRQNKFTSGDQVPRDIGATFRDCTDWRFDGNTCESLEAWLVVEKQRRQGFRHTRDNVEPLGRKCTTQVREVR